MVLSTNKVFQWEAILNEGDMLWLETVLVVHLLASSAAAFGASVALTPWGTASA